MLNYKSSLSHIRKYLGNAKDAVKSRIITGLHEDTATACEDIADAVLREKPGSARKLTSVAVGVMSKISVPAGLFGLAGLLGTASTGTAVGSLTGAAFTSSALVWLGGSIFAGTILVAASTIVVGIGGTVAAGLALKKYWYGQPRQIDTLSDRKSNIVTSARMLAAGLRHMASKNASLTPASADTLVKNAVAPLIDELKQDVDDDSPIGGRRKLMKSIVQLERIAERLLLLSKQLPNISIGVVSSAILAMLANEIPSSGDHNYLVLAAIRRSSNALNEASDADLAVYVQSLDEKQLEGLISNVKGIYHELKFEEAENLDGDAFYASIYEETNHAGADIKITNSQTGEITEIQLKATDYLSYAEAHQKRYEDIPVRATEEVASQSNQIKSSGFSNADITQDTRSAIDGLISLDSNILLSSATLAGAISLAMNVRLVLKGGSLTPQDKLKLFKDTGTAALTAGFITTFI